MFFKSWDSIFSTLISGSLAYIVLIVLLRVSGKRTLSKWNSFDFVVTIALGSVLASILVSKDTTLLQGVIAFTILILFQLVITWVSIRSNQVQELIKAKPTLLLCRGQMQHNTLKQERVTESEVLAAIRSSGIAAIEDVEAVVLETNGTFSVVQKSGSGSVSALLNVKGYSNN
ncbi:MAG: YetF domain-containing protein [Microcoleaceae cyanobacterium]